MPECSRAANAPKLEAISTIAASPVLVEVRIGTLLESPPFVAFPQHSRLPADVTAAKAALVA
jgi:hypothetical protein